MSDKYIMYDPAEFDKIEIKPVENSDKITRLRALRAALAAVTAERDRMRALLVCLYDAAGPLDADKMPADDFAQIITIVLDARAPLEGVTKKEGDEHGGTN